MDNLQLIRRPTYKEVRLIELLINKACLHITSNWKEELMVCPMNDGMMGSLYLFPKGIAIEKRTFGREISNFQFTDTDGVEVLVTLNIDEKGDLFELDIWKTNFQKLTKLPDL